MFLTIALNILPFAAACALFATATGLGRAGRLSRRRGAVLVGIGVPVLWPGIYLVAFVAQYAVKVHPAGYWIAILAVPNGLLLVIVGAIASGAFWVMTRHSPAS